MTIITKKVRLLAAPEPAFVGTRICITLPPDDLEWGFYYAEPPDDRLVTIEWGDGTSEQSDDAFALSHVYPGPGDYEVRFSDDVQLIQLSRLSSDKYTGRYAKRVTSFISNAIQLEKLGSYALFGCDAMTVFDVRESNVSRLAFGAVSNCTALRGAVYLPKVKSLSGANPNDQPFGKDTGITELHFAAANEEFILASDSYEYDPTLGTGGAALMFDL